jgi:hypothetical protein
LRLLVFFDMAGEAIGVADGARTVVPPAVP